MRGTKFIAARANRPGMRRLWRKISRLANRLDAGNWHRLMECVENMERDAAAIFRPELRVRLVGHTDTEHQAAMAFAADELTARSALCMVQEMLTAQRERD